MSFQSQNALGQAGLLIGAERILRLVPPATQPAIRLDDWTRASALLPGAAESAVRELGNRIASEFFGPQV